MQSNTLLLLRHSTLMLNNKTGQFLMLILLGTIWGSSFILMKKGLVAFNSSQVASLRLFFAGLVAVPFLLRYRKQIQKRDWLFLAAAGFIGNGFPAFMFTYAQNAGLESSLSGALNALTPLFTLLMGLLFFHTRTTLRQMTGLLIGLSGALLLVFHKAGSDTIQFSLTPFVAVFAATLFYGININLLKTKLGHIPPVLAGLLPLSIIAFPATGIVFASGTQEVLQTPASEWGTALFAIFILGVAGTAIPLLLFNILIQKTSALFSSTLNYLIPFVAALWGVLDGEPFGKFETLSLLLLLAGIYLIRGR